jgi:hypothetical protein
MLESYRKIWLEKRDARFMAAAVEAMIDQGNKEEALGLCMEGIELGEMSSTLGVLAGGLLISLGRGKEAAGVLRDVVAGDPGNFEARRLLRVVGTGESTRDIGSFETPEKVGGHVVGGTGQMGTGAPLSKDNPDSQAVKRIREIVGSFD